MSTFGFLRIESVAVVTVAAIVLGLLGPAPRALAEAEYRYCGRASYGRGAGEALSACASGLEKDGALCYPTCNSGYDGVGPVCWQICPSGYTDDGAFCRRDAIIISQDSYGRGAGTIPDGCPAGKEKIGLLCYDLCASGWNSDGLACTQPCASGYNDDGLTCSRPPSSYWDCFNACAPGYRDDGCVCTRDLSVYTQPRYERSPSALTACSGGKELQNGLCYTPCSSGYTGDGPVCWRDCPAGYIDDGLTCRYPEDIFAKSSYGRGAGVPLVCASGLEQDGALCYPVCSSGYDGVGPVCWENCPADYPTSCGTGCAVTSGDCAAGTLSPVPGPSCTEAPSATACNGSPALCDRRFDQVTFAMTHNAHAVLGAGLGIGAAAATNQTRAVYQQLRDGIRGMMIDVGSYNGEVWLCHGGCGVSRFARLSDFLVTLRRFFEANPTETVTLIIEHTDGVTSAQVADVFRQTNMANRAYVKPHCAEWPYLSQLGGRVVVFSQNESSGGIVERAWGQAFDNPYSYDVTTGYPLPYACTVGRGTQSGLFVMNHFVTPPSSGITGPYSNGSRLTEHFDACEAALYRTANFIALDYYEQGSFPGGSFASLVAQINAAPRLGRAWDSGCAPHDGVHGTPCSLDGDCVVGGMCVNGACVANYCGDGTAAGGEACDEGSANSDTAPNACRSTCTLARCGDGVVDFGEGCDAGNLNSDAPGAACRVACSLPTCGDGQLDPGEACDDGNGNADVADACRSACVVPTCGDRIVDTGEVCDDGPLGSSSCTATCVVPVVPGVDAGVGDDAGVRAGEDASVGGEGDADVGTNGDGGVEEDPGMFGHSGLSGGAHCAVSNAGAGQGPTPWLVVVGLVVLGGVARRVRRRRG